jgi:hypothetical protein
LPLLQRIPYIRQFRQQDRILLIYHFRCSNCLYESKQPLGASNIDQILTDVNTDFAEYRLFVCKTESTFIHADIHCKDFKGKCSSDDSILVEVKEIPPTKCPRCNQDLASESKYPLEMNDNST